MTNDLAALRALLHDRANVTPDVDALLTNVHAGAKRIRRRRRAAGLAGAVVVTTGALASIGVLAHRGDDGVHVAAPPPTSSVQVTSLSPDGWSTQLPPRLPFSVGDGWQVVTWNANGPAISAEYAKSGVAQAVMIALASTDPTLGLTQVSQTTVHGVAAVITALGKGEVIDEWQLSWPVSGGRWVVVAASGSPTATSQLLRQFAGSVTLTTSQAPSDFEAVNLPPGWGVGSWQGPNSPAHDRLRLCPTAQDDCVVMQVVTSSTIPSDSDQPVKHAIVNGTSIEYSMDGTRVDRELSGNQWLVITGPAAEQTVLRDLAVENAPSK